MAVPGLLSATSPTLVPSIVFVILFGISSILLGWRLSQNSSSPYRRLFLCFSLLRVAAFIARAFWSQDQNSQTKAIIAGVITASGYFLVVQSLYGVWVNQIADKKKSSFKLFIILCSIIGIIGIIGAVMQIINDANVGRILKKISTLGFLGLLIVLLFKSLTAQRDSNTSNPGTQKNNRMVLFLGCLLLICGMVYRIISLFEPITADVNAKKWLIYVFVFAPEWILVVFVCVINPED